VINIRSLTLKQIDEIDPSHQLFIGEDGEGYINILGVDYLFNLLTFKTIKKIKKDKWRNRKSLIYSSGSIFCKLDISFLKYYTLFSRIGMEIQLFFECFWRGKDRSWKSDFESLERQNLHIKSFFDSVKYLKRHEVN